MKFVGRQQELELLSEKYHSSKSELIVLHGRRRVGKSCLVWSFCKDKRNNSLMFEGIENKQTADQIEHFYSSLRAQIQDPLLNDVIFKNWDGIFRYITKYLQEHISIKTVLFFDELPWMASKQGKLISLLKYFWDNHWKQLNVMVIMCGSISSFMINQVIKSKALYGRFSLIIHVRPLLPSDAATLLNKRNGVEKIKYLILFGGIPKYLEDINTQKSFDINISKLCFEQNSLMLEEFQRIFYGQFRMPTTYMKIVKLLSTGPQSMLDIETKIKISSGGGLKRYIDNLINADFIDYYYSIDKKDNSQMKKLRITDEFICFYYKYIFPNMKIIKKGLNDNFYLSNIRPKWNSWMGLAFERFCLNNSAFIAKKLGISSSVINAGAIFTNEKNGYQIDLAFIRNGNVVTICEIKFSEEKVNTSVIAQVKKKCEKLLEHKIFKNYSIETCLISLNGAEKSVIDSEYFNYLLDVKELLS